ncbi:Peptidyl-prolyl cis-trans isomerase, cyclophilin type [metagenome]|uniref:Peptidyl-prolyl cis-trans isomerase, cyclophilin type n=1 Tax=metagenome TaxID=256318 RepID=A0A2P2CDK7_9ZZZZ
MLTRPLALAALLLTVTTLAACGGNDDSPSSATDPSTAAGPTTECSYPAAAPAAKEASAPPKNAPSDGEVTVTIATSIGDLKATLDQEKTPCTVNSFLSLADQGYFDGTTCHRLTTADSGISVLQCGDPSGTGSGGPGYSFADELSGKETYSAGTLAMANAGPDTNGSQFFMVYGDSPLPAAYTVFGTIDAASTQLIADAAGEGTTNGTPDGPPTVPVDIDSIS